MYMYDSLSCRRVYMMCYEFYASYSWLDFIKGKYMKTGNTKAKKTGR